MELQVDTPVQYLKGVGPHLAGLLHRKDIRTVQDLVEWYPRAYEDRRKARSIVSLKEGDVVSLKAQVVRVQSIQMGRSSRRMYDVQLKDESGRIGCKYFRVPFKGYFERFSPGDWVRVTGKVVKYRGVIQFHHPDIFPLEDETEELKDAVLPLYSETEGLTTRKFSKILGIALSTDNLVPDPLPLWMREKYHLPTRFEAIRRIHQPPSDAGREFMELQSPWHRRIIFEEFFWMELSMGIRRANLVKDHAPPVVFKGPKIEEFKKSLPFQLTRAQLRVFDEIKTDLAKPHPMHRLVQGDVGSGKTLVALLSTLAVAEAGFQSAIMAPTEILAEQHYKNAKKFLEPMGMKIGLLTGSTKTKERKELMDRLLNGEIHLLIGTHALIEKDVVFNCLALVVIDEQHRFGVAQRDQLKRKGVFPHFLVMTATPIPRTLAMTVYGDLDVSVVDELPVGRMPILTRVVYDKKRGAVYGFLKEQVDQGRQAYIVYPLVEESEKIDLKNAVTEFEKLSEQFPAIRFGLLHGKMKPQEKEEIMNRFRAGEIQVLVSTTVIEVGVDVANANMIIIEHAERFGLSQLHQLRGRVGRGSHKSYCVLMLGYASSEETKARINVIANTTDGFKIAEADLELRGPGEFLGTRQSGLPGFKMANLVRDLKILQESKDAVEELIQRDPEFSKREHTQIKTRLPNLTPVG